MKLMIATPSPYARKVRVALLEKRLPFEEIIDVPWDPATETVTFNPLGKVPVLITDDDGVFYDSRVILDYLETLGREPALLPTDDAARIQVYQLEALADGICDAGVLTILEQRRDVARQSDDWLVRQHQKIERGLKALNDHLNNRMDGAEWFVGAAITRADIAIACTLAYLDLRLPEVAWRYHCTVLVRFSDAMEARPSFRATRPVAQEIPTVK